MGGFALARRGGRDGMCARVCALCLHRLSSRATNIKYAGLKCRVFVCIVSKDRANGLTKDQPLATARLHVCVGSNARDSSTNQASNAKTQ